MKKAAYVLLVLLSIGLMASGVIGGRVYFTGRNVHDTAYCNHVLLVDSNVYANGVKLGSGGSSSLTATYVAFGNNANQVSGSSDFTYNNTSGSGLFNLGFSGKRAITAKVGTSIEIAIGDVTDVVNGTLIDVNDLSRLVTITNVPTYANDAAATTAGLSTGNLYKTTTSGSTILKIVP